MKTKIFILAALIFSLILFTVSCIADDPADESNNVSRSESTPQEESVNESTPPEESKPAEESKPEESIPPEESKPVLTQEEIKTLFAEDISCFLEKKKEGYVTEYENHTVEYYRADNSMYVKSDVVEYNYYDNCINVLVPYETCTYVAIKAADFDTFTEWIEPTTNTLDNKWSTFLNHIEEPESEIVRTETNGTISYTAENSYLHFDKYEGKVTTTFLISDTRISISAKYQYTDTYGEKSKVKYFSENYTTELKTNSAKKLNADNPDKTYEFENLDAYKAFADKLYAFYGSVYKYKLNNNTLNKAIYTDYKGTDSTGGNYYIIEKTVAVGTNDDFVKASEKNYYRLPGELYKYDSYAYSTEESYDYRRIWEGFNFHNPDYEYGAVITGDDIESEPRNQLYSDLYVNVYHDDAFFTNFLASGRELETDIKTFAIIAGRFDSITYTSNDDGTVTADFTCVGNGWTLHLLFGMMLNINSDWAHPNNVYDYTAQLTYDTETGLMTSLSIYCKATRNGGFWYEHKLDVTVTDADETMLPEKADLLAGNW
ncbi:MAG: hypothetical protein E7674_05910 [Ruminococcaceae bacterium]|nr:hypothetical protein [Oscillospiraceae bacterium]